MTVTDEEASWGAEPVDESKVVIKMMPAEDEGRGGEEDDESCMCRAQSPK